MGWLITILISIIFSVLSVFVYDRFFAQKVVSVDLKGFISKQRDLYLAGKLTDEQFRLNVDRVEEAIKKVSRNKVVIMQDAVVKNAEALDVEAEK